jgi:hypothetical protein
MLYDVLCLMYLFNTFTAPALFLVTDGILNIPVEPNSPIIYSYLCVHLFLNLLPFIQ